VSRRPRSQAPDGDAAVGSGGVNRAAAAQGRAGDPPVVPYETVYPLRRGRDGRPEPFPTLYWLTDPRLCRDVADLERRGTIRAIEAEAGRDAGLRAALAEDHARYARRRWAALTAGDRRAVEAAGLVEALRDRGVGGVADFATIKCLHAHVAHHLGDPAGNAVARRLVEEYGLRLG